MTRSPRGPGPAARVAIRVAVIMVLGVGLAMGVNWLDSQGLFFRAAAEPDSRRRRDPAREWGDSVTADTGPSPPRVRPAPPPRVGQLRVTSSPGGARILLCGKPTGEIIPPS